MSFKHLFQDKDRWWFLAIAVGLILTVLAQCKGPPPVDEPSVPEDITTYIPAGYVLVPITVTNFESLDSILGQQGVVDLFATNPDRPSETQLVVKQIRIVRSPLNPSHFAVLAPENRAPEIVRHSGSFYAVLQNPKKNGTSFEKKIQHRSRLEVESL